MRKRTGAIVCLEDDRALESEGQSKQAVTDYLL